jgi:hypothetical protein
MEASESAKVSVSTPPKNEAPKYPFPRWRAWLFQYAAGESNQIFWFKAPPGSGEEQEARIHKKGIHIS